MASQQYATADKAARTAHIDDCAGLIHRFYPFTEQGYMDAYNHAKANGYDVWEADGTRLHALAYTAREF
jgi:hypothetical protein